MDRELFALEERIEQFITLCHNLRAENQELRTRVAVDHHDVVEGAVRHDVGDLGTWLRAHRADVLDHRPVGAVRRGRGDAEGLGLGLCRDGAGEGGYCENGAVHVVSHFLVPRMLARPASALPGCVRPLGGAAVTGAVAEDKKFLGTGLILLALPETILFICAGFAYLLFSKLH